MNQLFSSTHVSASSIDLQRKWAKCSYSSSITLQQAVLCAKFAALQGTRSQLALHLASCFGACVLGTLMGGCASCRGSIRRGPLWCCATPASGLITSYACRWRAWRTFQLASGGVQSAWRGRTTPAASSLASRPVRPNRCSGKPHHQNLRLRNWHAALSPR